MPSPLFSSFFKKRDQAVLCPKLNNDGAFRVEALMSARRPKSSALNNIARVPARASTQEAHRSIRRSDDIEHAGRRPAIVMMSSRLSPEFSDRRSDRRAWLQPEVQCFRAKEFSQPPRAKLFNRWFSLGSEKPPQLPKACAGAFPEGPPPSGRTRKFWWMSPPRAAAAVESGRDDRAPRHITTTWRAPRKKGVRGRA
jgi:hypothetical protein